MRICFLLSSLSNGGAERVATTLCNAWVDRGDAVTLIPTFSGGGKPFYEVSDDVEVIYLADVVGSTRKSIWTYARRALALRRLIAKRNPDVVISFLPNVNLAAIFSIAFLPVPLIICERSDPSSYPYSSVMNALCKLFYRFADMLTVQTESVANKVESFYPGLKSVRTVPNPLPDGVAAYTTGANAKRKILLTVGRLASEKQIDMVLDAFSNVASCFDDWDLHIYGEGPLKPALEEQIHKLGLQDRAFLKGRTSNPWAVMAGADAFVMSSRCEGFPNALLEAMGVGMPCVVFDCPSGPREITRNGQDALLVPLNDRNELVLALKKIMGDQELRKALGTQARKSVLGRFSLPAVIKIWDQLFHEVGAIS